MALEMIMRNGECPDKLHFGCGTKIKEGYWNTDIFINKCSIFELYGSLDNTWVSQGRIQSPHSLPNNHFEEVFAEMVFEHIHPDMIPNTLYCLYHALKPNGRLQIIVPNFNELARLLFMKDTVDIADYDYFDVMRNINNELLDPTFEDEGFSHGHQSIWTEKLAKKWLSAEGYTNINVVRNGFYMEVTAVKPEGNPYGSPSN